jgi:hypothetical protein
VSVWRVRATKVNARELGLRWTLQAWTDDLEVTVLADTTRDGSVFDLQSDEYVNTTGDEALDYEVQLHIRDTLALRTVLQSLDAIDGARFGRIQRPADRSRWAT